VNELVELKSRILSVFDDVLARTEPTSAPGQSGEWVPRVDMYDLPERIVLRADVPGLSSDALEVRLEGQHLILRGTRRQPNDIDPEHLCRMERPFGSFVRRYALPDAADPEGVRASCRDGVLEVVVEKREPTATKRISVDIDRG
jgi:HSP20 family protein